eukprot:6900186-Prorocentrum_lima.AAC.1
MTSSLVGSEMCIRDSPPALCTAILRGIAAQHAREGQVIPAHVEQRLEDGRALYSLGEQQSEPDVPDSEAATAEVYEDAR